ncbi:MFS transporter [Acidaminobacter sp. JC074]|uniref:MFS transporter n=1 Tax=Acidaminobacter sp. JC074 TaxID=2530199 RepID=UPI001F0F9F60|nr:MFS transporter [Acidaminobacter sp. JC074]MCH4887166.1 MFS transporter [Acidaminobacter sp. JC074]
MSLTLKEKITYGLGSLGISLITVIHMLYLVYVFFPADNAGLVYVIPQTSIFMGLTVLGLVLFASRLFDVITDPLVAHLSDMSKHPKGKRLPFMKRAALPMGLSYVLVFFVPFADQIHHLNVVWLTLFMFLSALFLTLYSIPYYSLIVDMGKSPEDKIDLGTYSSLFWFLGFLIVSFATTSWDYLESAFSITRLQSLQLSFVIIGLFGVISLMVPVIFLDEKKYESDMNREHISLKKSLKTAMGNRNFIRFFRSLIAYGVATYIFESGLIYYITVLALLDEGAQGGLTTIIGVLTLGMYPLINKVSKKQGKKPVMVVGFILFGISFVLIGLLGLGSMSVYLILGMIVLLSPFSQACFTILPGVVTADCASYESYKTGEDHSAMYMAMISFGQKLGSSIGMILFTSFLLLGKDVGNDLGIRLAVFFSAGLCVIGLLSVLSYDEKEIMSYAGELKQASGDA